jgi:hypothetical protein
MLRQIYAAGVVSGGLLSALTASAMGSVTKVATGKVLVEAQAAGVVTKYELETGAGAVTPTDVAEIGAWLLNLYDRAVAPTTQLFPAGYGQGLIGDANAYAWMLAQLQPVRSFSPDFTNPGFR